MQLRHPVPQVPRRKTADEEYQQFWGPLPASPTTSNPSSRQTVPMISMSHSSQENHVFHDELLEFWHGRVPIKHGLFSGSYQDSHAAISQPTQREPVPVPSPAALHSNFSASTVSAMQCRGEGWQLPRTAGSAGVAPCERSRAKHVERGLLNLQVAKRAYKRACRRAEASAAGGTWYRGRWTTCAELDSRFVSSMQAGNFSQAVARDYFGDTRVKHLSLLPWNAGGLATHTWDGLQNWLLTHGVQIACVQETWWPFQRDWDNGAFYALHHNTGRTGGLLTMVSSKLAPKECIRSGTLANARVQHTRIFNPKGGLDVINVYQKVWSHASAEVVRQERRKVWDAIADCLDRIPAKNQVVVMGI